MIMDTPKHDVLTIIRDFNAKLGSTNTDEVMGKHGLGEIYNNGERLVEMCIMYYEQSNNRGNRCIQLSSPSH